MCVLVGFNSCCIFKYVCTVYMVQNIISHGVCFNYCIRESVFSIAYVCMYVCMYIHMYVCI